MNSTRTTRRSGGRSTTCTLLIIAALLAAGCGDDDDDDDAAETTEVETTAVETTAVDTTEVETTSSEVSTPTSQPPVLAEDAEIVVYPDTPTCVFRDGEILARFEDEAQRDAVLAEIEDEFGPFEPLRSFDNDLVAGLELISIEGDPLEAAQALVDDFGIDASPNYIFAFAPGWKYAPDDVPALVGRQVGAELSQKAVTIAVLDTGFEAVANQSPPATVNAVLVPDVPDPHTAVRPDEVHDGVAAGHGSFIVNMLGQLLPEATITPAGIGQRWDHDDNLAAPTPFGQAAIVRDDSSVTSALLGLIDEGRYDYLNLSFGTYGCTQLLGGDVESIEDVPVYLMPLALRTVLENWGGDGAQVFAASGNDEHRSSDHPEIFFPAGRAPSYPWLHSVASDPRDGIDYSNRGWWVEFQAMGTRVVSRLPATDWGPEEWYSWSGTSFATPCALAFAAATSVAQLEPASLDGTGPFTDCDINV